MAMIFDKDKFTTGEFINAVISVKSEPEAVKFVERYRQWLIDKYPTPDEILRANIGWCFGEGMKDEYRTMWIKVCGASHPVFGQIMVTAEEALNAGKLLAQKSSAHRETVK